MTDKGQYNQKPDIDQVRRRLGVHCNSDGLVRRSAHVLPYKSALYWARSGMETFVLAVTGGQA